jgi:protein-S-isoprenylcysteine O-methyltransferase Ste14
MLIGTALINGLGIWLVMTPAIAAGLVVKLRTEERLMTGAFGEAYERYRQSVPALIPWRRFVGTLKPRR